MKKWMISLAVCAVAVGLYAAPAAKAPAKVILDGKLTIYTPTAKNTPKELIGKQWLKGWGLAGRGGVENGKFYILDGIAYNFLITPSEQNVIYTLTVKAAAKPGVTNAKLHGHISSCIRLKNDKRGFSHDKKQDYGPVAVTAQEKEYTFKLNIKAFEQGYLYIGGSNILISSIRLVVEPAAK